MIEKTPAGLWTCHDHPDLQTDDEELAVIHLRTAHPETVKMIAAIEITPVIGRAAVRRAERQARRANR